MKQIKYTDLLDEVDKLNANRLLALKRYIDIILIDKLYVPLYEEEKTPDKARS